MTWDGAPIHGHDSIHLLSSSLARPHRYWDRSSTATTWLRRRLFLQFDNLNKSQQIEEYIVQPSLGSSSIVGGAAALVDFVAGAGALPFRVRVAGTSSPVDSSSTSLARRPRAVVLGGGASSSTSDGSGCLELARVARVRVAGV